MLFIFVLTSVAGRVGRCDKASDTNTNSGTCSGMFQQDGGLVSWLLTGVFKNLRRWTSLCHLLFIYMTWTVCLIYRHSCGWPAKLELLKPRDHNPINSPLPLLINSQGLKLRPAYNEILSSHSLLGFLLCVSLRFVLFLNIKLLILSLQTLKL